MLSDGGDRSEEDSRNGPEEGAPPSNKNDNSSQEPSTSNSSSCLGNKQNGGSENVPPAESEQAAESEASTSKEEAKEKTTEGSGDKGKEAAVGTTTTGKSKAKKKKKGAAYLRHRDFRKSKGNEIFSKMSPLPPEYVEEEVVTHVIGKKPLLGKVWKNKESGDYVRYRCYSYGIEYKPGDAVYIESQRPEQPYYICCIQEFKMSKRDTLMVHIKWYYRTNEVPEQVYQPHIQDRRTEHKTLHKSLVLKEQNNLDTNEDSMMSETAAAAAIVPATVTAPDPTTSSSSSSKKKKRQKLDDMMLKLRELFVSEATDVYPVSVLRGKCTVYHCQDIKAVKEFVPKENTFFFTLSYNPETRRLASTQGEIRVGASHQANLPEFVPDVPVDDRCDPDEELTWEPGRIHDHDLLMYLRAGRSMAAFAAMCDGGSPEEGFATASKDGIAANALQILHESEYDTGKGLQSLLKTPFPTDGGADPSRRWPEDDVKDFIKGLRMYGKNFFKIRSECLPHRETPDLVEFYYLWKKTPGAANNRPRGRRPRPGVLRRIKTSGGGSGKPNQSKSGRNEDDPDDLNSCSDEPNEESNNDNGNGLDNNGAADLSPYYCRHCFATSSRDWHHAGKEKLLACSECRIYFKRYGELPCLEPAKVTKEEEDSSTADEAEETAVEKAEQDDEKPPLEKKLKLDLNAIERDSNEEETPPKNNININSDVVKKELAIVTTTTTSTTTTSGPVEIKGELSKSLGGLVSPVPTMPQQLQQQPRPHQHQLHHQYHNMPLHLPPSSANIMPPANLLPGPPPPPAHSSSSISSRDDIQVLPKPSPTHQQQPHVQPPAPREPSPPPKIDGSECHRSQSAIFTRQWNRGEGNSCSRTDLSFKPVPDSELARKREERLRKANEREDALKAAAHAQEQAAKVARMEINPFDPFSRMTPNPGGGHPGQPQQQQQQQHPGMSFGNHMSELERMERDRAQFMAAAAAARSPYPGPPGTPGPGQGYPGPPPGHMSSLDGRRLEEFAARASAERQYAERMALATDPLVRLQMAGVNPEIPGASAAVAAAAAAAAAHGMHPAYASLLNSLSGGRGPPPGFDPRFRSPAEMLMRPPGSFPGGPPPGTSMDMLQRQLLMEREHSLRAASAQQHASLLAQQEEFLRMEHEARARQAGANVSRP